jgi:RNA polymerase sigma-70 factor (ECF subfamily)
VDQKDTFLTAIKANERSIYKIASAYTNDTEDRNDLIQEIIYQLWKSFGTFNQKSSLSTWMYRVAMNVAIYHLKKVKRKVFTVPIYDYHSAFQEMDNGDEEERWKLLKQYIDNLNLLDKGIVILYLEEKSYEEIAEIIGISVSNVGTKMSRIKAKLKQQISKQL